MELLKKYVNNLLKEEKMEQIAEQHISYTLDQEKREAWKKKLEERHGLKRTPPAKKVRTLTPLYRGIAIAASLALLIAAFFLFRPSENTYQQLADSYLESLPPMADQLTFRTKDDNKDVARANVENAYLRGDYETAIPFWQEMVDDGTATAYDQFYLGQSYLRQQDSQPELAIPLLLSARADIPEIQQEINWTLSLAYLKAGQLEEARQLLATIVQENAYMQKKARKLLAAIDDAQQN
jgi:hypothetical protein